MNEIKIQKSLPPLPPIQHQGGGGYPKAEKRALRPGSSVCSPLEKPAVLVLYRLLPARVVVYIRAELRASPCCLLAAVGGWPAWVNMSDRGEMLLLLLTVFFPSLSHSVVVGVNSFRFRDQLLFYDDYKEFDNYGRYVTRRNCAVKVVGWESEVFYIQH